MNASSLYQRAPRLLAGVALLLSCVLFFGCRPSSIYAPSLLKDLFGDHLDQFPSVVLDANGATTVDTDFNWTMTTLAGVSISNFAPSAKFWRLNVFYFNGTPISHNDWQPMTNPSVPLRGLPTEKLLRARLELTDDPTDIKKKTGTINIIVLFHNE